MKYRIPMIDKNTSFLKQDNDNYVVNCIFKRCADAARRLRQIHHLTEAPHRPFALICFFVFFSFALNELPAVFSKIILSVYDQTNCHVFINFRKYMETSD